MKAEGSEPIMGGKLIADVPTVSVAAHELKSPLVLLRQLSLELLSSELSPAETQRILEQMVQTSEKGLRLTGDLTRTESLQEAMFECSPVNSLSVAEDVAHELHPLYTIHQRSLRIGRVRHLPPVIANRDLLRRILYNFVDNALHYSDIEGVVELQAQLLKERSIVRLSVRDYGPSMPYKQWRKLSSSLSARQPVHARPQSSGLGIYIAHQFASAMNGTIGAIRHRDGASFYVELPVSRQLSLL
jgi:signal transduction histidine kinase